ncbi:DNA adenine methylase [Streptomyces sp. AS02]|uniref:DNA adenine methylase n=1 Tax=Streptomyces sp. AS02 TaxID=2938946 RepID=UPI00202282C4|nr:DNA adenine methylase [Streptomyces sp. AS02]MCL8017607.1 DNA adenine methylase [Streptomyces sp. AS02]
MMPALSHDQQPTPALMRSALTSTEDASGLPRRLVEITEVPKHPLATARYQSPLRYPGAKSGLGRHIKNLVDKGSASLGRPQLLVEPFAGGASTALRLVGAGSVARVLLADADPLVAAFWQTAAADTEWLIDRMHDEPVTLERWDYWRRQRAAQLTRKEAAVKCLFLNRTTFSGILHGRAGPIGGRTQSGRYRIDCRFNKESLAQRLRFVGRLYDDGHIADVWCKDWSTTLHDVAEWYPMLLPDRVIAYLDPPYLAKSPRLYAVSFDPAGGYAASPQGIVGQAWEEGLAHYRLAHHLRTACRFRWILSYDHDPELTTNWLLYKADRMTPSPEDRRLLGIRAWYISKRLVNLHYTASGSGKRRLSEELLLTTLPSCRVPADDVLRPLVSPRAAGRLGSN